MGIINQFNTEQKSEVEKKSSIEALQYFPRVKETDAEFFKSQGNFTIKFFINLNTVFENIYISAAFKVLFKLISANNPGLNLTRLAPYT
jgi:hypothetical protein